MFVCCCFWVLFFSTLVKLALLLLLLFWCLFICLFVYASSSNFSFFLGAKKKQEYILLYLCSLLDLWILWDTNQTKKTNGKYSLENHSFVLCEREWNFAQSANHRKPMRQKNILWGKKRKRMQEEKRGKCERIKRRRKRKK